MYFQVEKKDIKFYAYDVDRLSPTPHIHPHIEIVFMLEGSSAAAADEKEVIIEQGDIYIAMPNQIHYYIDIEKVHAYVLVISPEMCAEYNHIFKRCIPQQPLLKDAAKNQTLFNAVNEILALSKSDNRYDEIALKGHSLVMFSEIFKNMTFTENNAYDYHIVKDIINYCYENYTSDISLQSISDALHVSRYYVSHLFNQRMHVGFSKYINSLRIQNACDMLKRHENTITEIGYASGYNWMRSFNRCFINERGMTPKEYRTKAFSKGNKNNPVT